MTKGVVIAGTGSGVGKTSIVTGLLSSISKRYAVQPFKIGPDFIDPMYHTIASGRQSRNLDAFMMSSDNIKKSVATSSKNADICVVEGVRGLYEGISGTSEECSTAQMSKFLGFPVVLVIDATSLTRSAAAMINGFASFDKDVNIKGVILNKVSGKIHEEKLRDAINKHCNVEILGVIKKSNSKIGERHLGLDVPSNADKKTITMLDEMVESIDIDALMDIADGDLSNYENTIIEKENTGIKVAIPTDQAYCFYYPENIEALKNAGMNVIQFSPVAGDNLPDADFYYLGGGYPEVFSEKISNNHDFLEGLYAAACDGIPILGECGGMLTMCSSLTGMDGIERKMAGIFDAKGGMGGRCGPSYVMASSTKDNPFFKSSDIKGHEYHYSDVSQFNGNFGYLVHRGTGIQNSMDGMIHNNCLGSYLHRHALSDDGWVDGIIDTIYSLKS